MASKGLLVVVSSPSGGGKTTVIKNILKDSNKSYIYSVSLTTRARREGELDGQDYWFVEKNVFEEKIKNHELIEYERVHDYYYGTPKKPIEEWLAAGKIVLMDIDVKGALAIKKAFRNDSILIFLKPPNMDVLKTRLKGRSTETPEQVAKRLTRVSLEMDYIDEFDYTVINNKLTDTVDEVKAIINQCVS